MGYKVYLAIVLWHLGIRKILPSAYVNKKSIRENNSRLIDLSGDKMFSMDERAIMRGGMWVRVELAPMLRAATQSLPKGYKLHFFGGWRHIAAQWMAWDEQIAEKRAKFPNLPEQELKRVVRMTAADPSRGGFGPHQTGGAIDLTLVKDGKELDMGTSFSHHGKESMTDYPNLTKEQKMNRKILCDAMHGAGFQNYPGEWWHYSYGDRAWAAYGRKSFAIYNRIDNPEYKLKPEEKQYADKR